MQIYLRRGSVRKRARASSLFLKRTAWLDWPVLYWGGGEYLPPKFECILGLAFLPILREKLRMEAPGFFVVRVHANGRVGRLPVDAESLGNAAFHLLAAEKQGADEALVQSRRKRLFELGSYLREAEQGGVFSCWNIDAASVRPPATLRLPASLRHSPAIEAICQFFFPGDESDLGSFIAALEVIEMPCSLTEQQVRILYSFAAAASRIAASTAVLHQLAWFLSSASERGICDGILPCLTRWITSRSWNKIGLSRFITLLQARGAEIISRNWEKLGDDRPDYFWALPDLCELVLADALTILDRKLFHLVPRFRDNLSALVHFSELVSARPRRWRKLPKRLAAEWISLFSTIKSASLLTKLTKWLRSLADEQSLDLVLLGASLSRLLPPDCMPGERRDREQSLCENFHMLAILPDEVKRVLSTRTFRVGADRRHELWVSYLRVLEVAYFWREAEFGDWDSTCKTLLDWIRSLYMRDLGRIFPVIVGTPNGLRLQVALSGGCPGKLVSILGYEIYVGGESGEPYLGWAQFRDHPDVYEVLRQQCETRGQFLRLIRLLTDLARVTQTEGRTQFTAAMARWEAVEKDKDMVRRFCLFRKMTGCKTPLSIKVKRFVQRSRSLGRELQQLREKKRTAELSPSAERRLAKLERLFQNPTELEDRNAREVSRRLRKLLPLVKYQALHSLIRTLVQDHWNKLLGKKVPWTSDWENAMRFYYNQEDDRPVLLNLFRARAMESDWRKQDPANIEFIGAMQSNKMSPEAWLSAESTTIEVNGALWTLEHERDPLRILQMGNYFGTCLSAGEANAFSAVTNAIELNKSVLYLKNERGHVIGRKLIGLTLRGRLIGFRSYGAACLSDLYDIESNRVWIKILFDVACARLAAKVGALLAWHGGESELELGREWYDDGAEEFDWWIRFSAVPAGNKEEAAIKILLHIRDKLDAKPGFNVEGLATLRALLWLGDEAAWVLDNVPQGTLSEKARRFLRLHSPSRGIVAGL